MTDERDRIANDAGFEIVAENGNVVFADRQTLAPTVATWVTGGIGFLFVANGAVQAAMAASGRSLWAIAGGLGAGGVVMIFVATRIFRVYRDRRDRPIERIPDRLVAHMAERTLRTADGRALARFDELGVASGMDLMDHSRGLMRIVTLKWPRGSRRIFKTNDKDEIARVTSELARRGIGKN
ncbi:MAG: hypothetical protein KJ042_02850 [Deltaproteobacteria bacterium]|nr:hypothetical protein [Deltaproteobacteria bacterium]